MARVLEKVATRLIDTRLLVRCHGEPEMQGIRRKRIQDLAEVGVVVSLTLLPSSLFSSVATDAPVPFWRFHGLVVLFCLQRACLIAYLLWIRDERLSEFGICKPMVIQDSIRGAIVLISNLAIGACLLAIQHRLARGAHAGQDLFDRFPIPNGLAEWVVAAFTCLAVGVSEELLVRGYLLTRLESVLKSSWPALILSAVLFGLAHGWKSPVGVFASILAGLVFGLAFLRWRRLWPIQLAHAGQDFLGFVLAAMTRS